jgi:hypothetical protein
VHWPADSLGGQLIGDVWANKTKLTDQHQSVHWMMHYIALVAFNIFLLTLLEKVEACMPT